MPTDLKPKQFGLPREFVCCAPRGTWCTREDLEEAIAHAHERAEISGFSQEVFGVGMGLPGRFVIQSTSHLESDKIRIRAVLGRTHMGEKIQEAYPELHPVGRGASWSRPVQPSGHGCGEHCSVCCQCRPCEIGRETEARHAAA